MRVTKMGRSSSGGSAYSYVTAGSACGIGAGGGQRGPDRPASAVERVNVQ